MCAAICRTFSLPALAYLGHEPPLKADTSARARNLRYLGSVCQDIESVGRGGSRMVVGSAGGPPSRLVASAWCARLSAGQRRRVAPRRVLALSMVAGCGCWMSRRPISIRRGKQLVGKLIGRQAGSAELALAAGWRGGMGNWRPFHHELPARPCAICGGLELAAMSHYGSSRGRGVVVPAAGRTPAAGDGGGAGPAIKAPDTGCGARLGAPGGATCRLAFSPSAASWCSAASRSLRWSPCCSAWRFLRELARLRENRPGCVCGPAPRCWLRRSWRSSFCFRRRCLRRHARAS